MKGKGEVEIVQLANPIEESKWIAKRVKELLDKGVDPSEIIVLVQRKRAARVILNALKEAQVPAKSYYEESQLETDDAQMHFAAFKLLLNKNDRVALRYLLGIGSPNFRVRPYARLRDHCETSGDTQWDALEKMLAGTLTLKYTQPLVNQFGIIKVELDKLEPLKDDVPKLIDELFPDNMPTIAELRELALAVAAETDDADELFSAMMKEITQPDIPPEVKDVRVMSLHKSKGLSSPYVFIAQCIQGVLPQMPKQHAEGRRGRIPGGSKEAVFCGNHAREGGRRPCRQSVSFLSEANVRRDRKTTGCTLHQGKLRPGAAHAKHVYPRARTSGPRSGRGEGVT
jgi:DNA helicase-2/ATP-dependent DNA helicase PcrA